MSPRYLLFAETTRDGEFVECHLDRHAILPEDVLVVALSVQAEQWFLERDWNVVPLDRLVDLDASAERRYAEAIELANTWFTRLAVPDEFYEQAAIPDFMRFFLHAMACDEVLTKTLPSYPGLHVLLKPDSQLPVSIYGTYAEQLPHNGVFNAMLRWHCQKTKVRVLELRSTSRWERLQTRMRPWLKVLTQARRRIPTWRLPLKALIDIVTEWTFRRRHAPGPHAAQSCKCDAMIINWGVDAERHLTLADIVAGPAFAGLRMVHLIDPIWPEPLSGSGPASRPEPLSNHVIRPLPAVPVEEMTYFRAFFLGVVPIRWWRFVRRRKALANECAPWFGNRHLDYHFLYLFFEVYEYIFRERRRMVAILRQYSPTVVIGSDGLDVCSARARLLTAREYGVTTLTINHGFYLYVVPRHILIGDYCLVGGPAAADNFARSGVPRERIRVIGNPSFGSVPMSHRPVQAGDPTIVITTSASWPVWSLVHRCREHLSFLEELCDRLTLNRDWTVIIKSHPGGDLYTAYDAIVSRLTRRNLSHVSEGWSREQFGQATVAVVCDASGALIDLLSRDVPVVFVSSFVRSFVQPDYQGCGEVVSTAHDAEAAVRRLVRDGGYREDVMARGRAFFRRYTDAPDNKIERFASVLRELVELSEQADRQYERNSERATMMPESAR